MYKVLIIITCKDYVAAQALFSFVNKDICNVIFHSDTMSYNKEVFHAIFYFFLNTKSGETVFNTLHIKDT